MKAQSYILATLFVTIAAEKGTVFSRFCRSKFDCGANFGYICGQNQTCHCDRFYVLNTYSDKCVGGVGQKCRYDEHCIEGAFCEYQIRCQCKEELYPEEGGLMCSKTQESPRCDLHLVFAMFLIYLLEILSNA